MQGKLSFIFGALGASCALSGCDLADGLADLGNGLVLPDAALLDAPGRRVAAGTYRNLTIDGSTEKGGYVIAIRTDQDTEKLSIVEFLDGKACDIDAPIGFERISSRVNVDLPGLLAVQVKKGEESELRFVDFDCQSRLPALPNTAPPRLLFPLDEPKGSLALTSTGDLYFVNPEGPSLDAIATKVTSGQATRERLFTLSEGKVIAYDTEFEVLDEFGNGVDFYVPTGASGIELLFHDADGLHGWSRKDGLREYGADACLGAVSSNDPSTFAYFSPCDERRVVVEVEGTSVGSSAPRVRFFGPANVDLTSGFLEQLNPSRESTFAFLVSDAPAVPGTSLILSRGRPGASGDEVDLSDPEILGENYSLRGTQLFRNYAEEKGDLYGYLPPAADGAAPFLERLAPDVAAVFGASYASPQGVLAKFDGSLGELWRFPNATVATEPEPEVLAKRVPKQFVISAESNADIAFVGEFNGETGEVFYSRANRLAVVADAAFPNTLRYLSQPKAISFLRPSPRGEASRLSAYLIESELNVDISDGVTEYRAVPWPSPGILYAKSEGSEPGLWFAKAR